RNIMAMSPAVFLDKDGTLLADVPYNVEPARMRFCSGALEGLRRLGALGIPLIVISNQPGIAFGRFRTEDLDPMISMLTQMCRQAGAAIVDFYYCPHHP